MLFQFWGKVQKFSLILPFKVCFVFVYFSVSLISWLSTFCHLVLWFGCFSYILAPSWIPFLDFVHRLLSFVQKQNFQENQTKTSIQAEFLHFWTRIWAQILLRHRIGPFPAYFSQNWVPVWIGTYDSLSKMYFTSQKTNLEWLTIQVDFNCPSQIWPSVRM